MMEKDTNIHDSEDVSKNYNLNSQAVEDLASDDAPEYSEEELNRYRKKKGFHFPEWLKMVLLKAWFAGAVGYFIVWGLGMYLSNLIDFMFVLGIAIGLVTDLLLNNVLRFLEKTPGQNNKWMLIPPKGVISFALNLVYGFVIAFCVYYLYDTVNQTWNVLAGTENVIYVGVEPLLFGLFCMGFDMLFIGIKRLLGNIIRDARQSASSR